MGNLWRRRRRRGERRKGDKERKICFESRKGEGEKSEKKRESGKRGKDKVCRKEIMETGLSVEKERREKKGESSKGVKERKHGSKYFGS